MGEKIIDLAVGDVKEIKLEIELNHSPSGHGENHIHLQTGAFRLELTRSEYIKDALTILLAQRNLKNLKNYDE